MEPEGSLLCFQQPVTGLCPEPHASVETYKRKTRDFKVPTLHL